MGLYINHLYIEIIMFECRHDKDVYTCAEVLDCCRHY